MYSGKKQFQTCGRFMARSADDMNNNGNVFLYIWSSDILRKGQLHFWEPDSAHTAVAVYSGHMDIACESCYLEPKVIYSLGRQISWAVGKAEPRFQGQLCI